MSSLLLAFVLTCLLFLIVGVRIKMVGGAVRKCIYVFIRSEPSSNEAEGSLGISRGAKGKGRGKGGPKKGK
jgi:hypothetical protein